MVSFPKYFAVFYNFFGWFSFDFFRNGINFISTIFLVKTYKLIKVTFTPISEALNLRNISIYNKNHSSLIKFSSTRLFSFISPVIANPPFLLALLLLALQLRRLVSVPLFVFFWLRSLDLYSMEPCNLPCFYSGRFLDQEAQTT